MYLKNKEKLYHMVENDPKFHRIGQKAGRVINVITGAEIEMDESEEYIDMCQAIRELREEAKQIGREEGRVEGLELGRQQQKLDSARNLLRSKLLTPSQIAQNLDLTLEEVIQLSEK